MAEGQPFAVEEAANAGRPPGKACSTVAPLGGTAPDEAGEAREPETDLEAATPTDAWSGYRHFVTLYGWLPSFRGDVKVKGVKTSPALSRNDIWNNLDLAFMGRYEVVPPESDWSFWLDAFYSSLEEDASAQTPISPISADANVRMSFVELVAAWHVWRSEDVMAGLQEGSRRTQLDLFGGARYARMRFQVDVDAPGIPATLSLDESEDWWDPMVGARVRYGLAPAWLLTLRGDVGGFDIGTSSKLAWTATTTIQHMITDHLSVGGGWKVMDLDYERGDFEADVRMSGPFVTLTYDF